MSVRVNKELFRKLARRLRRLRHEEHYNQAYWAVETDCGTATCLAGHVAVLKGWKFMMEEGRVGGPAGLKDGKLADILMIAAKALRVPTTSLLFSGNYDWPHEFYERLSWMRASPERPSRVAADLCDAIADGTVKIARDGTWVGGGRQEARYLVSTYYRLQRDRSRNALLKP